MDAELKEKWIEALRSGKYEQGRGFLRRKDKYCCLGVLCDLIDPEGWTHQAPADPGDEIERCWYDVSVALPLHTSRNIQLSEERQALLVCKNDDKEYSFDEIATYIESTL